MRLRSRIPNWPDLPSDQFRYLEGLDRRLPARSDLTGTETAAQITTILNTLFDDLRDAGLMERQ